MRVDRRPMWSMVPAMSPSSRSPAAPPGRRATRHRAGFPAFSAPRGRPRSPPTPSRRGTGVGSTEPAKQPSCPRRSRAGRTPCATGEQGRAGRDVRPEAAANELLVRRSGEPAARDGGDVDQARGVGPDPGPRSDSGSVARTQRIANARSRRRTGAGRTLPANRSDWRKIRRDPRISGVRTSSRSTVDVEEQQAQENGEPLEEPAASIRLAVRNRGGIRSK